MMSRPRWDDCTRPNRAQLRLSRLTAGVQYSPAIVRSPRGIIRRSPRVIARSDGLRDAGGRARPLAPGRSRRQVIRDQPAIRASWDVAQPTGSALSIATSASTCAASRGAAERLNRDPEVARRVLSMTGGSLVVVRDVDRVAAEYHRDVVVETALIDAGKERLDPLDRDPIPCGVEARASPLGAQTTRSDPDPR